MPRGSCEKISVVYDDHTYNICMSNRKIYVLKLKTVQSSSNGTTAENDSLGNSITT